MQLRYCLSLLSLVGYSTASALASSDIPWDTNTPQCPDYCAGTEYNASLAQIYVCGDSRLGPRRLPRGIILGDLLNTYDRFGGLCPGQFLAKWYDPVAASYIYPKNAGFQNTTTGVPIEGNITLAIGFLMDRFGSEYGNYSSPQGAPYMQRALPPINLDTPQSKPVYVIFAFRTGPSADRILKLVIRTTTMFITLRNLLMSRQVLSRPGLDNQVREFSTRCRQIFCRWWQGGF